MIYKSLEGVILSFVGEKWQNLPFLGKARTLVSVFESGYRYPLYRGELVPVPKVGVPVPLHQ